ncbi:transposase, partial [Teichococcus vastitatis]|uniref:transposase n=1 Tax=Teichococcus vastitatis TaxID=2307076 RepID=UPI003462BBC0
MVTARPVAAAVRQDGGLGRSAGGTQPRQLAHEGPPLGGGWRRGEWTQAVGRSRGGHTSKIHCLADDRGRRVAFALTPGNIADISMALPLLGAVTAPRRLIADKAYDAESLRRWLRARRIKAVIPSTATRTKP